jgi:hypothetical protein
LEFLLENGSDSKMEISCCDSPGGVSQVHGEQLDDEKVIGYLTRLASEVVVLQPDTGVSFTIVLDDIARHLETLWEASIMHGASECFWPRFFRAEATSFVIIMASAIRV